jgi:hypothetical protein
VSSGPGARPVRFGVVLDGDRIESWQAASLEKLLALGVAEPALVIIAAPVAATTPNSLCA